MIDMIDLVNWNIKELNERINPQFFHNISLPTNVLGLAWLEIGVVLSKKKVQLSLVSKLTSARFGEVPWNTQIHQKQ